VQYARRILQPLDPAQYSRLREQDEMSLMRQQLLLLPIDASYTTGNRSGLYSRALKIVGKGKQQPLPLLMYMRKQGIPCKQYNQMLQAGYVNKPVPTDRVAQVDALIEEQIPAADKDAVHIPQRDWMQEPWQHTAAELEQNGYAVIENVLSPAQVEKILNTTKMYVRERGGNFADALSYSPDFVDLIDIPEVLDVIGHWLGPNIYVNHSHVTSRKAGLGAPNAWHQDGGTELPGCTYPMFMKVGFVLTDMSEEGKGNFGCLTTMKEPVWEMQHDPNKNVTAPGIVNAETVLMKAGSAVLFEKCWHSGMSNADNVEDRYVFYVQYARRILQPLDPAQYSRLREQDEMSLMRQQLLLLPTDVQYLPNNRSSLYHPSDFEPLPLHIRQERRKIPYKEHNQEPPAGCINKAVPMALVAQVDALIQA